MNMRTSIPTIAMTATATRDTRKNIADSLGLRNFVLLKESPEKMNIKHTVYHTKTRDCDDICSSGLFKILERLVETLAELSYIANQGKLSQTFMRVFWHSYYRALRSM